MLTLIVESADVYDAAVALSLALQSDGWVAGSWDTTGEGLSRVFTASGQTLTLRITS